MEAELRSEDWWACETLKCSMGGTHSCIWAGGGGEAVNFHEE